MVIASTIYGGSSSNRSFGGFNRVVYDTTTDIGDFDATRTGSFTILSVSGAGRLKTLQGTVFFDIPVGIGGTQTGSVEIDDITLTVDSGTPQVITGFAQLENFSESNVTLTIDLATMDIDYFTDISLELNVTVTPSGGTGASPINVTPNIIMDYAIAN